MEDYQFPFNEVEHQRISVYQKLGATDQSVVEERIIEVEGTEFLTYVSRNENIKFDSSIISLDESPKLVEIFRYNYDSLGNFQGLTKGVIEKDEYFANGTPYGGKISHIKYEHNNIESEHQTIDDFTKDTVYQWKGVEIPALYFKRKLTFEVSYRYIPFLGKSKEFSGYTIYAKNLGIVKYGNEMDGELIEWKLVEIK